MYRKELLKGSTETLILSLLTEESMYGYQLVKEMEFRSSGYFQLKEGTLYPALHRLERDGLVGRDLNLSDRRRFDVHLTDQGRTVFERLWPGHQQGIADGFIGPLTSNEIAGLHKTMTKLIEANEKGQR